MALGCELRVVYDMTDSGPWAQESRCHEQLKAMNKMNNSKS